MKLRVILALIICWLIAGSSGHRKHLPTKPKGWPEPVHTLPSQPSLILLGRVLFYDPLLSADSSISCASCHSPYNAFAHTDHALSHGIHDSIGKRNAPALINLAWRTSFRHDGQFAKLEEQILLPIQHPGEMAENFPNILHKQRQSKFYPDLFKRAYGDTLINQERNVKALKAFLLSLISANAKYDSVQNGTAIYTEQEEKGYQLYRKNCSSCHTEPLFTNNSFEDIGLPEDPHLQDKGRSTVTGNQNDNYRFQVPTLRNISYTYPYMHDGRFTHIRQILDHYSEHIEKRNSLSTLLQQPIQLNPDEKVELTSFLLCLNDKNFIFHSEYGYPKNIIK